MAKLPTCSGAEAVRAFCRGGYEIDHQTGSHIILRHPAPPNRRLTVPNHAELKKGTLRALIRDAGLTVDQFVELLRG
jgi:predicted RNA binding protein YcfA (HicA-like mRNA interferase family)